MFSKNSILTLFFAFFSISLIAQVSIGFRGGLTSSGVSTSSSLEGITSNFGNALGTEIAGVAEIALTDKFALQSELVYTTRGFKVQEGVGLGLFGLNLPLGAKVVTKMKYLEIPVLAKYHYGNGPLQAYITAGPTFGYATSGKINTKASVIFDIPLYSEELNLSSSGIQRFDIGASIGGGVSINTGAGKLFVDARYKHSFTPIDNIAVDLEIKNRSFGLTAGYLFSL